MKKRILILLTCILTTSAFAQRYNVQTIAGTPFVNGYADGTNSGVVLSAMSAITCDQAGNLYMCELPGRRIRKAHQQGANWVVTTIAGSGAEAELDGIGTNACFTTPCDITIDLQTNLYVVDSPGNYGNTVRKISCIDGTNWMVTTIAGMPGVRGNTNSIGTNTLFNSPQGIAADPYGHLYVADTYNNSIRRLTHVGTNWVATTLASGFPLVGMIAVDAHTNIYFYYQGTGMENLHTIERLTFGSGGWIVTTNIGSSVGGTTDGTNSDAQFEMSGYSRLTCDQQGNLFVAESSEYTIRKITHQGTNWIVTTIAGQPGLNGFQDGTTNALFNNTCGITVDPVGRVFICSGWFQSDCTLREAAPIPALTVRPSGTNAVVSWPNLGDYSLLTCTDMKTWTNCPQPVAQNQFTNTVTVPIQVSTNVIPPTPGSGTLSGGPVPPGSGTNTNGNVYQTTVQLFRLVSN